MNLTAWPALLIGATLMIVPTSQEVAAQKQTPVDPYAQVYHAQRVERYKQSRQRLLTIIKNLYFSFGCKVFPDETSITPLILNEYKQLLRGQRRSVQRHHGFRDEGKRPRRPGTIEGSRRV